MGALAIAVLYVLFVWWFSTGTVLLLIGLSGRREVLLKAGAAILFAASLAGVAASSQVTTAAGAYCVFTCAILLAALPPIASGLRCRRSLITSLP
jgi:putative photosynthetic complex assembly protein 2